MMEKKHQGKTLKCRLKSAWKCFGNHRDIFLEKALALSLKKHLDQFNQAVGMETPVPSKTPRRKLKRITVKNKLSHKKLRTAINVSLNTSHNIRTLRMNNRSLAHRLEGLKKEYRAAFDAYQSIQEENHLLRQKVVSLECIISDPDSYIEERVNTKFEAHVREFKNMIQLLHANVEGLSENLKSMDEMCVTTKRSQRCYSMDGILSREPPSLPSPSSLRFQNDVTIRSTGESESNNRMEDEMNLASDSLDLSSLDASSDTNEKPLNDDSEMDKQNDMSMILEQSVILGVKSPLKNIERNIQPEKGTINSKLPRRVLTRSKERRGEEPDLETTESAMKAIRKSRRATRILSDDEVNVLGILDIEPPSDLLLSPKLPSSSGDNDEQRKDIDEPVSGDGPFKEPPVTVCHNSNAQTKKKSNVKLHKKVNKVQSQAPMKQGKGSDGLFISNEFALINAHEQITKKLQATDTSEGTRCTDDRDNEEHTVLMVEDMDLTMPVNVDISIPNVSENHFSFMKRETSDVESNSSEPPNFEEFCPEAVTLQRTKPGQFKFAASRKETDGRRKSLLSQPPRARSKSKKVIAHMIENLPQEEPKSIFDFHDKTPTQISDKEKDMSVYSLGDESSLMSPPTPLGRTKSKSRLQGDKSSEGNSLSGQEHSLQGHSQVSLEKYVEANKEVDVKNTKSRSRRKTHGANSQIEDNLVEKQPHTEENLSNDKGFGKDSEVGSVLGEGIILGVPLNDDFDTIEKLTTAKSRGRSRRRTKPSAPDPVEVSNDEENGSIHTEKISAVTDGMTHSFPLKDDSSNTGKITVRNSRSKSQRRMSRARSKNRANAPANEEQTADSEDVVGNTNEHALQSQQSSKLEECRGAQDVPLKNDTVKAEMVTQVTVKKSSGQSKKRYETSLCKQPFANSQELLSSQDTSTILPKEMSALGEGIIYSVPLKDDSDEAEKVTVRKSRGRSRTRGNEEAAHDSEVANSHHRMRSQSRRRQDVQNEDESCETASPHIQRKSRGRSRTRDKAKGSEKTEKYQTTIEGEKMYDNEKMNATDLSEERHDENLHQEMVTVRKCRGQSQEIDETSTGKQPFGDSEEVLSNQANCDTLLKELPALGEGVTYSVPLKEDSDETEKVTVKKSRGRSRTRGNEEAVHDSEVANSHHRMRSRSRRRQNVQNEDESCETVSPAIRRKSRGRSRTRDKAKGSEKPEKCPTTIEGGNMCDNEKINATDLSGERHDQNLHQQEMITVKKSRGQSQEISETSTCKKPFGDSEEVLSNQANSDTLPKEMSALGKGITYSVPLKDDSDETEKVTVRKSRGRSRTRGNEEAAYDTEVANSHHRMRSRSRRRQDVQNEDVACETVSPDTRRKSGGRSRTRDKAKGSEKPEKCPTTIEGENMCDNEKINATDLSGERHDQNLHQQEMITGRKSRGQSQEISETSTCKKPVGDSEEVLSNQANSDTLPKEMSALGEGITYSVPLKDDSDETEKVTVRKSRGRSRTRGNEEAAYDTEVANSHHRMRSRSRRRQDVQNEDVACETVSPDIRRKSGGRSRTRDKAKGSEKPEKYQTTIEGEKMCDNEKINATDLSEERQDNNFHQPKKTTKSKAHDKTSGHAVEGAQEEQLSDKTDKEVCTLDSGLTETESRKRKSPPKSLKKKMPKSSKKMKKCEVKSATASPSPQKNSKSPMRNGCTESSSQHLSVESTSRPTSPQDKCGVSVDGTIVNKSEANERFGDGLCGRNLESIADSQQVKTSGSLRRNKKGREQNSEVGKAVCDIQEIHMERLKNLYTPESFKRGKEWQSPLPTNRQPLLSQSQSLSDSLEERSATKETNMEEPSGEPSKRRRAAAKCASYAEPSLGGKLRRGDPFTSIGPGKVPIYKSPKALKKIKVKRNILGPLQNHLVEEETS